MSKLEDHFVHKLVLADCSRDRRHFRIRRHLWNETFRVEFAQLIPTRTAGQYWYVINVRVFHHSGECVPSMTRRELVLHMLFPKPEQMLLGRSKVNVRIILLGLGHSLFLLSFEL